MRRRSSPVLSVGCAVLLSISSSGLAGASSGVTGIAPVTVRTLPNGAAISSVQAGDVSVTFIVRAGSSVSATSVDGSVQASMRTTRPKSMRDASAYREAGRSVIGDLVALGMPRGEAERQFGDMATLDGAGDGADVVSRQLVRLRSTAAALAAGASTPYDTQCAAINVAEGKI